MYFTNEDLKKFLQEGITQYDVTNFDSIEDVHYLVGFLNETIKESVRMIDRMEQDKKYEKYRQQEETEFNSHLGRL